MPLRSVSRRSSPLKGGQLSRRNSGVTRDHSCQDNGMGGQQGNYVATRHNAPSAKNTPVNGQLGNNGAHHAPSPRNTPDNRQLCSNRAHHTLSQTPQSTGSSVAIERTIPQVSPCRTVTAMRTIPTTHTTSTTAPS